MDRGGPLRTGAAWYPICMLEFASSMSLAVNSKSAARECVEQAEGSDADVIVLLTSVGHNASQLVAAAREAAPGATAARGIACWRR